MDSYSSSAWIGAALLGPAYRTQSERWINTASALSSLSLDEISWDKRWTRLLLDVKTDRNWNHPFYRLDVREALVLVLLSKPRWRYDQINALIDLDSEALAWRARLKLSEGLGLPYPSGPGRLTPGCPEYQDAHPWTQRHLDRQLGHAERIFLEQHLQRCSMCRDTLARARIVYFAVQDALPWTDLDSVAQQIDEDLRVARDSGRGLERRRARSHLLLGFLLLLGFTLFWFVIR